MNCSTVRSFTPCARIKSWSRNGDATKTTSGPTAPSATGRPRRKPSCQWARGRPCTNIQHRPLNVGSPRTVGGRNVTGVAHSLDVQGGKNHGHPDTASGDWPTLLARDQDGYSRHPEKPIARLYGTTEATAERRLHLQFPALSSCGGQAGCSGLSRQAALRDRRMFSASWRKAGS